MPSLHNELETHITLMNGRIRVRRCQASSKRSKQQCKKAVLNGKRVCMFHGGKSTGLKKYSGRKRCAAAKTIHGRETRKIRSVRAEKLKELREIEQLIRDKGLIDL